MLRLNSLFLIPVFIALVLPSPVRAQGDPARGAVLAEKCVMCHGTEGENRIEGFPNLANQHAKYLVKQLREMRASAKLRAGYTSYVESEAKTMMRARRTNEVMDSYVIDLKDEDINDLAAYYSSKPCRAIMTGAPLPPPRVETRCQVCHGKYGNAKNPNIPNIAGQDFIYLEQQMLSFKTGKLQEGDGQEKRRAAIMEGQVRHLSEQDITDLSLYYARLPCR